MPLAMRFEPCTPNLYATSLHLITLERAHMCPRIIYVHNVNQFSVRVFF
jgi:hypothetical protein